MTETDHRTGRRRFIGIAAAALALPSVARGDPAAVERIGGRAFGTLWRITAPAGSGLARLRPRIDRLLAGIDRQMSPWRPDSEISAVNRGGAGRHPVSPETAAVTLAALGIARDSGGCFDPTVGPLVGGWGFGPMAGARIGGWRDLDVAGGAIGKAQAGVTLDLCGIAKGHALDRMTEIIAGAGYPALLDLGGELCGVGRHPSGRAWQVAVEDPRGSDAPAALIALEGRAVATSSLLRQSYEVGGRRYGHIADPRSGAPAAGALGSVTVLAAEAATADGWATALFAAGAEAGPALARHRGLDALFLIDRGGRLARETTGAFAEVLL